MRGLLAIGVLLTLPSAAWAGRARLERTFLEASCAEGRLPAGLRFETDILPKSERPWAPVPDDFTVITAQAGQLQVDGTRVRPGDLASTLRTQLATRPQRSVLVAWPAELPASTWSSWWRDLPEGTRVFAVVELTGHPRPESIHPETRARILRGRAAVRRQVDDPFSRLAALEAIPVQIGLPEADCSVFEAVLRTPLGPDADCPARVADAQTALAACALRRLPRSRAVAALGEAWSPTDRAAITLVDIDRTQATGVVTDGRTWGRSLSDRLEGPTIRRLH